VEELTLVVLILGTLFGTVISAIWYKNSSSGVKKARKRNEISLFDNLTQYREVEKGTIMDILKQKDKQLSSLNARLKQFEPNTEEETAEKGVTWQQITSLVQTTYPQYSVFLPYMKKQILEMTKGMSMDEILQYVKQLTGNKQPQGGTPPESATFNPNWA